MLGAGDTRRVQEEGTNIVYISRETLLTGSVVNIYQLLVTGQALGWALGKKKNKASHVL